MKIAYASDLHLEFADLTINNTVDADVLVLAGDILVASDIVPTNEWFFENVSKQFKHVLYVMGNHEHYHGDFQRTPHTLLELTWPYKNVHLLNNSSIKIDDVTFFGGTLWTDMNIRDYHVMEYVGKHMNDFRVILNGDKKAFSTKDAVHEHVNTLSELEYMLEGDAEKVVVVSHHSPSPQSIHPRYKYDTEMNYGYHSRLEWLMMKHPKIKVWIHGHVHDTFDYEVYDTRVVCNPRGYANYESRADKFELAVVEV